MDIAGVPSPHMDWDACNLPVAWRKFKLHVELMFSGPFKRKAEDEKCSYLLLWVGDKGRDIYNTWTLTEDERKVLKSYYDRFEAYVMPKSNVIFARYKFHEKVQGANEPFEQFVTDLRLLVKDCNYASSEEMIRDRIVFGIQSPKVREKLLNVGSDLTLDKAIDIARSHEIAQAQLKTIDGSSSSQEQAVHAIGKQSTKKVAWKARQGKMKEHSGNVHKPDEYRDRKTCSYCGNKAHESKENCPAKGKQCKNCNKWNHFAKVCHSRQRKEVHTVSENELQNEDIDSEEDLFIDAVTQENCIQDKEQAFANVQVGPNRNTVKFKLDTGASANVIPTRVFKTLRVQDVLEPSTRPLYGYGGEQLVVRGRCNMKCQYKDMQLLLKFHVVDTPAPPVLGLKACVDFGLIKFILSVSSTAEMPVMEEFADVFKGIGLFPGECTIHVEPDAVPVVHPPRRVPIALRDRLREELQSMEKQKIIARVTEPTEWVNSMVAAEKPRTGKLRICLDPRDLNKVIKRPHYPLPTLDDITSRLAGARYFSVMDAKSGYWAIKLTEESSKLTTFNTVFGRYRFLRLPFGLKSAQDEFQRKVNETYEDLQGVMAIVDDILIYGKTEQEHDENLRAMLQRSRERGVKLNPEKSVVCATEVSYFGHLITKDGVKPDPAKIAAIKDMKPPKDKGELETILGMVNYLSKFAPGLASINAPLRHLLKESSEFVWDTQHDDAFKKIKELITREPGPVLTYFDPSKELTLQVDASKYGLGAVLLQEGKPIGYASKALTDSEINYAQIEKELYAILFGCKRFHQYVYGHHITVESDHKPLESIIRKPLAAAPPRLQRMFLQLQRYDFTIIHRPGKDIPVADTLSRKSLSGQDDNLSEGMDMQVHMLYNSLPVSDTRLEEIKAETDKDIQLRQLKKTISEGWPEQRKLCPQSIAEYWNHRDELSQMNDIIFKGEKIVIPESLRVEMLSRIHVGHMGIEKCKQRARDILFWPGMSKQVEEMVGKCSTCLEYRSSNTKEPMISHKIPERPWQTIASDMFTWNNEQYIVTVDYYSRYFELDKLNSTTASAIILKLKAAFARHGIPETVVSDNGPQYKCEEFEDFANKWEFTHITTSPHYPQSNGLAEKSVQIAKTLLEKAKADKRDPYLSLLEYRNTPVDNFASPAQLLMSRRLRSILPSTHQQLQPNVVSQRQVHTRRVHQQQQQKKYYDRSAKHLPPLQEGQFIRFQKHGHWKPAIVIRPAETDRSYHIRAAEGGQEYRRNRRHLLDTKETQHTHTDNHTVNNTRHTQHSPALHTPQTADETAPPTETYKTRSGREVKPRTVLDL